MELIISCTEVLTLLSDEHFGNVEIKWKNEFLNLFQKMCIEFVLSFQLFFDV